MGAGDILYSLYKSTPIFVEITTAFGVRPQNDRRQRGEQC
jgi:hypothetical protein